jgi:alpha-beta hydrolase superfamily lysophospholipase
MYVMIGASLYLFQEKLLFLPTELHQDYPFEFGYPFDEVFLHPEPEVTINAIHFKVNNPKGVILYFHGNAGDLSRWGKITEYFVEKNYDVLVMDYRTYGKSKGKLSENAFYNDAQYCYNYLLQHYPEEAVILYGRSLGTGIASFVAHKNKPKTLILETPYYSIEDVAKQRFPVFPVSKLLRYKFPTYEFIQSVNCPIFIFHGTDDKVVPYASGLKLKETASSDKITFISLSGGGHNNLMKYDAYNMQIDKILN